jgi:hypothetical protein
MWSDNHRMHPYLIVCVVHQLTPQIFNERIMFNGNLSKF